MKRVCWSHLFLQDRVESSRESASKNLSFPVSSPEATLILDTERESCFIFASDVLKYLNTNTAAAMFGRGKHDKERSRELMGFVLEVAWKRWLILHDFQ